MRKRPLKIIFVDQLPKDKKGYFVHYNLMNKKTEGWSCLDVKQYIHEKQNYYLKEVEDWHAALSKTALNIMSEWWFANMSRYYPWNKESLKPLLFSIAVNETARCCDINEVFLVRCPRIVGNYIKEINPGSELSRNGLGQFFSNIITECKQQAKFFLFITKCVIKNVKTAIKMIAHVMTTHTKKTISLKQKILVFSIIFDEKKYAVEGDYYFGSMFDDAGENSKNKITWLLLGAFLKKQKKVKEYLTSRKQNYVMLENVLSGKTCCKVLWQSLKMLIGLLVLSRRLPALKINGSFFNVYPREFFYESFGEESPILSYYVYETISLLIRHSKAKTIIYPYEERGFERALVKASKEKNKNIKVIGYHHGIHKQTHRYYRQFPEELTTLPRPDMVAVIGPAEKKWFIESAGANPEKVVVFGSCRYSDFILKNDKNMLGKSKLKVLVLTGTGFELDALANYVENSDDLFKDSSVLIRKKPFAKRQQMNLGAKRLEAYSGQFVVDFSSLQEQLEWCDVAIYCTTTAGVEAMLSGRLTAYMDLCDLIRIDPNEGKGDSSHVIRCYSAKQLKSELKRIASFSCDEYSKAVKKQRDYAKNVMAPIQRSVIQQYVF